MANKKCIFFFMKILKGRFLNFIDIRVYTRTILYIRKYFEIIAFLSIYLKYLNKCLINIFYNTIFLLSENYTILTRIRKYTISSHLTLLYYYNKPNLISSIQYKIVNINMLIISESTHYSICSIYIILFVYICTPSHVIILFYVRLTKYLFKFIVVRKKVVY